KLTSPPTPSPCWRGVLFLFEAVLDFPCVVEFVPREAADEITRRPAHAATRAMRRNFAAHRGFQCGEYGFAELRGRFLRREAFVELDFAAERVQIGRVDVMDVRDDLL